MSNLPLPIPTFFFSSSAAFKKMSKMSFANVLSAICLIGLTLSHTTIAADTPQDFVDAHNAFRAQVGTGPVSWDDELAAYAQRYIESKIETCEMVHSDGPYGENLASAFGELTAANAVKAWADEKKYYDYNSNTCMGGECRHYTQLVWRDSMFLGCASVKCKNNWVLVSCNYNPPGNYIGDLPY